MRAGTRCLCRRCGKDRHDTGRQLCWACRRQCERDGTLADYPRQGNAIEDVLPDFVLLDKQGHTHEQIATRIGMTVPAMRQAVYRARKRGLLPAGAR